MAIAYGSDIVYRSSTKLSSKQTKQPKKTFSYAVIGAAAYLSSWFLAGFPYGQTKKGCDYTLAPDCGSLVNSFYHGFLAVLLLSFILFVILLIRYSKNIGDHPFTKTIIVVGIIWPLFLPYVSNTILEGVLDRQEKVSIQRGTQNELTKLKNLSIQPFLPEYLPRGYRIYGINASSSKKLKLFFDKKSSPTANNMFELSTGENYNLPEHCPKVSADKEMTRKNKDGSIDIIFRPLALEGGCQRVRTSNVFMLSKPSIKALYTQREGILIKAVSLNNELSSEELTNVLISMETATKKELLDIAKRVELYPPPELATIPLTEQEELELKGLTPDR